MMSRSALLLALALATALPVHALAQDEETMLAEINEMREEEGIPPLNRHPALDAAARAHSEDMAEHQMLDHVSPRTGDPITRVRAAGVQAARVTENIALRPNAEAALQSILSSPPHRAQLLSANVTDIGIGIVQSPRGVYVTQVLARIEAAPEPLPPPAEVDAVDPPTYPEEATVAPPTVPVSPEVPQVQAAPEQARIQPPQGYAQAPQVPAPQPYVQGQPPSYAEVQPQYPQVQVPNNGSGVTVTGPSAPGSVTVVGPDGRRVAGYWVLSRGHWFFYPLPPNWHPGMQLQPDLSVQGPPPGYDGAGQVQVQQPAPMPQQQVQVVRPVQPYYQPAPVQVVPASPYGRRALGWRSPRRGASVYVVSPRRR